MKILTTSFIALIVFGFIGCTKDDSSITSDQALNNKFTIDNNVDFPTKSCYFEIDEDDDDMNNIPDNYGIWLMQGEMLDNDSKHNGSEGEYLISMGQTYVGSIHIDSDDNPVLVNSAIQAGVTYNCEYHFAYNLSVTPLTPPFIQNGLEYGEGVDDNAIIHETSSGTILFTGYTADVSAQTGTLDFDYSFVSSGGISVEGHFDGQILVIFD